MTAKGTTFHLEEADTRTRLRKTTLEHIVALGLHDALVDGFSIDYRAKTVSLEVTASPLSRAVKVQMQLRGVSLLSIEKQDDDLGNDEVILEFDILDATQVDILTTSLTTYRIRFQECDVFIGT